MFRSLVLLLAALAIVSAGEQPPLPVPSHLQLLKSFATLEPVRATGARPACGHILILPASPKVDAAMVMPLPKNTTSPMPVMKSLPPCEGEVRRPAK